MQGKATRTELLNYGEDGEVVLTEKLLWWQERNLSYTASGYGAKIPTRWVVNYAGRIRRVYCTIYSNIGTCWFMVKGKRMIVE